MRLSVAVVILLASSPVLAWGDCEFRAERRLELDAAGLRSLVLKAGAGDLRISGEAGRTRIEAVGEACADSEKNLAEVQIVGRRDGERAMVQTQLPESGWASGYSSLSLQLRVPAGIGVEVTDSSGDTRIEEVATAMVSDSSGDLRVQRIGGPVVVDDSSGNVEIVSSLGPVTVRSDSSGDLDIGDIELSVEVVQDSSGNIAIRNVRGDALVRTDSSGDIELEDIRGNAEVGSDSSGNITANRIGGGFRVGQGGSGEIDYRDVTGPVSVPEG